MFETSSVNFLAKTLKFHQLRLVIEIADKGSILKAADAMNITQSAATKSLTRLEAILGVKLFERLARGMQLTQFGEQFLFHSKLILSQLRYYAEEIQAHKAGTLGRVVVGTLIAATANLLPNVIAELTAQFPTLHISVIEGTGDKLVHALQCGEVDIIVGRLTAIDTKAKISQHYLYDDPISLVCGPDHPLVHEKKPLQLADLVQYRWILPPRATGLRQEIERSFARRQLSLPSDVVESVSLMTNINLLSRSDFIVALPSQVIEPLVQQNRAHIIPVRLDSTLAPVGYMIRDTQTAQPSLDLFISQLRQSAMRLYRLDSMEG